MDDFFEELCLYCTIIHDSPYRDIRLNGVTVIQYSRMKTVLFFISSTRHTCTNRLAGISRYAKEHDWHVKVVERAFRKVNVQKHIDFCRPIGVIAECGNGADELNASTRTPAA